jgi:hypothetical protein
MVSRTFGLSSNVVCQTLVWRRIGGPEKSDMSVRPFLSSDLRSFSVSSGLSGFGGSKTSDLNSRTISCSTAVLSDSSIRLRISLPSDLAIPCNLSFC